MSVVRGGGELIRGGDAQGVPAPTLKPPLPDIFKMSIYNRFLSTQSPFEFAFLSCEITKGIFLLRFGLAIEMQLIII